MKAEKKEFKGRERRVTSERAEEEERKARERRGLCGSIKECHYCLQRGHWTFECRNSRVYVSRSVFLFPSFHENLPSLRKKEVTKETNISKSKVNQRRIKNSDPYSIHSSPSASSSVSSVSSFSYSTGNGSESSSSSSSEFESLNRYGIRRNCHDQNNVSSSSEFEGSKRCERRSRIDNSLRNNLMSSSESEASKRCGRRKNDSFHSQKYGSASSGSSLDCDSDSERSIYSESDLESKCGRRKKTFLEKKRFVEKSSDSDSDSESGGKVFRIKERKVRKSQRARFLSSSSFPARKDSRASFSSTKMTQRPCFSSATVSRRPTSASHNSASEPDDSDDAIDCSS